MALVGLHAPRPGRAARLDLRSRLQGGLGAGAAHARPLAAQLAIYLGYVHYGVLGATLVGAGLRAAVVPDGRRARLGLRRATAASGWMQAVFYGVGAGGDRHHRASAPTSSRRKTIGNDRLLVGDLPRQRRRDRRHRVGNRLAVPRRRRARLAVSRAAADGSRSTPSPRARVRPAAGRPGAPAAADSARALARSRASSPTPAAFVFGSGLAIVPFLYGGVVKEYGWLDRPAVPRRRGRGDDHAGPGRHHRRLHRLPGRRVLAGAVVAALATFLPCYLLTIIPGAVLQEARQAAGHRRLRRRRDGRRDRRDRRRGDRPRPALDHRLGHRRIGARHRRRRCGASRSCRNR